MQTNEMMMMHNENDTDNAQKMKAKKKDKKSQKITLGQIFETKLYMFLYGGGVYFWTLLKFLTSPLGLLAQR